MAGPERQIYLFGFTELGDVELPDGPLGTPSVVALDGAAWAIVAHPSDTWSDDQLDDVHWIAPRAIHHDQVLRAAVDANVVPLRFGSLFADEASFDAASRPLVDRLPELFDRLRGRHEYRVSVRPRPGARSDSMSGADYLRRRQRELASEQRAGDTLIALAANHAESVTPATVRTEAAAADVLASTSQLDALTAALSDAELDVSVDGPLPPYHSVSLSSAGESS